MTQQQQLERLDDLLKRLAVELFCMIQNAQVGDCDWRSAFVEVRFHEGSRELKFRVEMADGSMSSSIYVSSPVSLLVRDIHRLPREAFAGDLRGLKLTVSPDRAVDVIFAYGGGEDFLES